jgi:N-acetylmuramoyl-L-alanine amidase
MFAMKRGRTLFWILVAALGLLAGYSSFAVRAADDLQITVKDKTHNVDSRDNRGRRYFELKDIVGILGLESREENEQAVVSGPRGDLLLTDNRPVVRFKDEYILLDLPVWRRKDKDWYVSPDFLEKALPLILSQKLEKQGNLRFRVRPLDENRVQVEVTNFPDHVRISFTGTQKSPVRVQEVQDSILVQFGQYLVVPGLPATRPDQRIVTGIEFIPAEVYGAFRIQKGDAYYNFREYSLEKPERKILDLYAPPVSARGSADPSTPPSPDPPPAAEPWFSPGPAISEPVPTYRPHEFTNLVTVDPGHGGEDYGVQTSQDELEKNYTLQIAQRVEQRLRSTAYRAVLTRTRDAEVGTAQRSEIGNYHESKCYVSIHLGGAPSEETRGPTVYVYRSAGEPGTRGTGGELAGLTLWESSQRAYGTRSRQLADLLQAELNGIYGTENKVVEVPLAQLASIAAPAVLIEAGFLTNPSDRARISSAEFQDQLATAIVKAMEQFLPRQ